MPSDPLSWHWNDMGDMKKEERMLFKCYVPSAVTSSSAKSAKRKRSMILDIDNDIRY